PRIAVGPVRYRRIDELRIRHDHRDVVVGYNHRAAGVDLLHLPDHAGHLHAVADRDRPLGQNHESADEITGDVLEPESHAHADRSGENRQGGEVDPGIFQDNENPDDENEFADDLRDGVLKGTVQPASDEEPIEEDAFRARGKPEDRDEEHDEEEDLNEAQRKSGNRSGPEKGNAGGVDRADGEEDNRRNAQDRGYDRGEIGVQLEAGEKTPRHIALESRPDKQSRREQAGKCHQAEEGHVMSPEVEKRPLEEGEVHLFSLGEYNSCATRKGLRL